MIDLLKIPKCAKCGKLRNDVTYNKDSRGESLYWLAPPLCKFTNVRVEFCGPKCSLDWTLEKTKADLDIT